MHSVVGVKSNVLDNDVLLPKVESRDWCEYPWKRRDGSQCDPNEAIPYPGSEMKKSDHGCGQ